MCTPAGSRSIAEHPVFFAGSRCALQRDRGASRVFCGIPVGHESPIWDSRVPRSVTEGYPPANHTRETSHPWSFLPQSSINYSSGAFGTTGASGTSVLIMFTFCLDKQNICANMKIWMPPFPFPAASPSPAAGPCWLSLNCFNVSWALSQENNSILNRKS